MHRNGFADMGQAVAWVHSRHQVANTARSSTPQPGRPKISEIGDRNVASRPLSSAGIDEKQVYF